ncbi:MAG: substrate binding domain-containing protein, partial [Myxococcota bacterium]
FAPSLALLGVSTYYATHDHPHPFLQYHSPFRIVASPSYLAQHATPQTLADLAEHDCVVFGPASAGTVWTLPAASPDEADVEVTVRGRVAVNHMAAVRDAAVAGLGVALLPEIVCGNDIASGDLAVLLPGVAPPPVPIFITYPAGRFVAPAVRAFVGHVRDNFARLVALGGRPDPIDEA